MDGTYGDIPYGPDELEWIYGGDDPEFYSGAMGGVQRLPNGNTLIAEGAYGEISEVTEAGGLVWYYVNPVLEDRALFWDEEIPSNAAGTIQQNEIFLTRRYDASYPGLSERTLTPGDLKVYLNHRGLLCLALRFLLLVSFADDESSERKLERLAEADTNGEAGITLGELTAHIEAKQPSGIVKLGVRST